MNTKVKIINSLILTMGGYLLWVAFTMVWLLAHGSPAPDGLSLTSGLVVVLIGCTIIWTTKVNLFRITDNNTTLILQLLIFLSSVAGFGLIAVSLTTS